MSWTEATDLLAQEEPLEDGVGVCAHAGWIVTAQAGQDAC